MTHVYFAHTEALAILRLESGEVEDSDAHNENP